MEKVRIDKFLWAIRLFKTRTAATTACNAGKIKIDGVNVKPSRQIEVGNQFTARVNYEVRTIEVKKIIAKRVSATIAADCYIDHTVESEAKGSMPSGFYKTEKRERGTGRPTKRERRTIDKYKDNEYNDEIF